MPVSDLLQEKQLNLSIAINLVESTCQTILEHRNDTFSEENIWKPIVHVEGAENLEIPVTALNAQK